MSVTARGGYQILDLHSIPLSDTKVKIDGIFEQAKNGLNKPILIVNMCLVEDGYTGIVPPQFSFVSMDNSDIGEIYIDFADPFNSGSSFKLFIQSDDNVFYDPETPNA